MLVLGIDPGTQVLGWGIISEDRNNYKYVISGSIKPKGSNKNKKLYDIFKKIGDIIDEHEVGLVAIERTFYRENVQTTLRLGEVIATVILAALERQLPVHEFPPREVKKSVTGRGNASKSQVGYMVCRLLNIEEKSCQDELDALAVSLCWGHKKRQKDLIYGKK
ncbi:crossover junction endodeoxyribonuclease RuvC [bacterium]|nr:crossover junction endodeoxyribonuclease RuvC [bacterium]